MILVLVIIIRAAAIQMSDNTGFKYAFWGQT